MRLIIDGYNVLHETMPPPLAGLDEAGLCRALDASVWRSKSPVVVCDGRPKPLGLTESPVDSVELIYSGQSRTADDVIIAMIEAASAPRRLTIVSSDREIRKAARRRRAVSWTSDRFLSKLVEAMGQRAVPPPEAKPSPSEQTPEEVEAWLRRFGFADAADDQGPPADDEDDGLEGVWPPW